MKLSSIAWNLAGLGAPLLAALLSIPPLLNLLGKEGFGLLALAWALTALSGLFDLGLGRATTRLLAEQAARGDQAQMRQTLSTALRLTLPTGCAGALLFCGVLMLDLKDKLHLAHTDVSQVREAVLLLALCVPVQALIATYRGSCEGLQQFRGISLIRMTLGCANFFVPWAIACYSQNIALLVAGLLLTRLAALIAFRAVAARHVPDLPGDGTKRGLDRAAASALLKAGGWLSVSAVASPLLVQTDRFAIATVISTAAATSYAVPFDLVTQLLIVVSAVSTVAFPSIASALQEKPEQARLMFHRWLWRSALGMAVVTGSAALLLPWALPWWVGTALPADSVQIGQWLCLGVWINALGAMYYAWLHAQGRFRATASLHLAELPGYLLLLWLLLGAYGTVGAAMAWVLRVAVDSFGLYLLSRRSLATRD